MTTIGNPNLRSSLEQQAQLNQIYERLQSAERFEEIQWELERELLDFLQAERLTIYRRDRHGREIISYYRSGDEMVEEIRLPLSPTSVAGYVAMSHQSILVDDVYDADSLKVIHPQLAFDYSFDEASGFLTQSMVVVPIKFKDTLLGVLQVINKNGVGGFTEDDKGHVDEIANLIGQKFRFDLKTTLSPFDYLIKKGKISLEQLETLDDKATTDETSITLLMTEELGIPLEEVGASLEQYYQVPFFPYNPDLQPDTELLEKLNSSYLASNFWVPLAGNQEKAIILIDDPNDHERIMDIQNVINARNYEFLVGLQEDILKYLGFELSTAALEEPDMNLEDLVHQLQTDDGDQDAEVGADLIDESASTIVQIVNRLIIDALNLNASDVHIEPSKDKAPASVRMRVDGVCREVLKIPAQNIRAVVARIKVLSRLDIAENRKPQDGKMTVKLRGRPLELRIATLPTVNGESCVMRVLAAGEPLPIDKLNLTEHNRAIIDKALTYPNGLFLVVGPTGSGKTTSLHAVLGVINTPECKILTAEDPVEITQPGLQQVQVMPKIGYDFAMALRAFLRCDPDVILIGEMRDYETAHSAIEASLTGHMVFSTLHTNSAPDTMTRLLDMGLDPINFADALIGVLAQRLVRTLCENCKEAYKPEEEELDHLVKLYGPECFPDLGLDLENIELMKAVGCDRCLNTGYKGRTGLHEALLASGEMKKMISQKRTISELREQAVKDGMRSILQDGIYKILKGATDYKQLLRVTSSG